MSAISRILVANRGEIAVRVIRACHALGIEAVAATSAADRQSLAAQMADRAICIGPAAASESYLKVEAIVAAALGTGCDAVHPGYGFLAERPELADLCREKGVIFVGPTAENIRRMGNKLAAKAIALESGAPTVPGSDRVDGPDAAVALAKELGFPVLLKAAAGGGGRGMSIVRDAAQLRAVLEVLSGEVHAAFGDGSLYIERLIENARHVEVQVLGDHHGNVIHLGERDCSVQRRFQKVVEEAPSPAVSGPVRERICGAAVAITRQLGYRNAGTVEFLFDQDTEHFYFMEMNTRVQVEHPVTEEITGVDLIQEQIRIASGERLRFSQDEICRRGHAIECRINAESPKHGFRPCPGTIREWVPPQGAGVRVDTHCYPGYTVPPFYDSLVAKLIVSGSSRPEAIARMTSALDEFRVEGIDTTIPLCQEVVRHPDYVAGRINTHWLEDFMKEKRG